jgi:HNH endonuclease
MVIDWNVVRESHIRQACKEYDEGKNLPKRDAQSIWLYFRNKAYPAKHIQGRSYFFATGKTLNPGADYKSSNGKTTKFFEERGLETTQSRNEPIPPATKPSKRTIKHPVSALVQVVYLTSGIADENDFDPTEGDWRDIAFRQIKVRRGQQAFRNELRQQYGDRCMVSGCTLMDVVDAAHIKPYRGKKDNHYENGLLLRTDLHTLFDLDYMGIDPKTLKVEIHPEVREVGYRQFDGVRLQCDSKRPSVKALSIRWRSFLRRAERSSESGSSPKSRESYLT